MTKHYQAPKWARWLTRAMDATDEVDSAMLVKVKRIVRGRIEGTGGLPRILDGIGTAMILNDTARLVLEVHKLRSSWRACRWDRSQFSREWLEGQGVDPYANEDTLSKCEYCFAEAAENAVSSGRFGAAAFSD